MSIHITKEAIKAETALRRIRKNAERAIQKTTLAWIAREAEFVKKLAPEVQAVLTSAGVLSTVPTQETIDMVVLTSMDEETVEEAELLS